MKNTPSKIKWILFAAFAILFLLLVVNIALVINNKVKQHKIEKQQQQLEQLKDKVSSLATVTYKFDGVEVEL